MKRRLPLLLAGLLFAAAAEAGDSWSSLWTTNDQRGQQLLNQGQPAAAAQTYADPRRKAYAELQAGDYAAAAKAFGAFDDSDAAYNRGNALAHSGDLQEALKAYDAALARNPDNRDARHNRDLVAQALNQQKQTQQDQSQKQQQGKQDQKNQQSQQGQQGQQGRQGQQSQSGQQQASSGQGQPQNGQNAAQNNAAQQQDGKSPKADDHGGQQPNSANASNAGAGEDRQQPRPGQIEQGPQPAAQQNPAQAADEAAQAQRDAAAGLRQTDGKPPAGTAGGAPNQSANNQSANDAESTSGRPLTEQQLSQDQWLRRIPDDPGGLLRRKFMIEHLMRQQNQQSPQEPQDPPP